jgi:hypothetical protein
LGPGLAIYQRIPVIFEVQKLVKSRFLAGKRGHRYYTSSAEADLEESFSAL